MNRDVDRDGVVDQALRRGSWADASEPAGDCPDAETVAAWTEGSLPEQDAALLETHLADCSACQQMLGVLARTQPPPPAAESVWQRWRLRWMVPVAAAATAVAIWVAVPEDQRTSSLQDSDSFRAPASAPTIETPKKLPEARSDAANGADAISRRNAPASPPPADTKQEKEVVSETDRLRAEAVPVPPLRDQTSAAAQAAAPSRDVASSPTAPPAEAREMALLRQARAPVEIVSPNTLNRWRIGAGGAVERSTSGGKAWEPAPVEGSGDLIAGSSPAPLVCWLVGRNGTVRVTMDGARFESVPFPERVDLTEVRATSGTSAIVTTADGRQFRTEDQGKMWSRVP